MKIYKDYAKDPYSFLGDDATFPSDKSLRFWKNLLLKWVLVTKSKQSVINLSKTKLSII